MFENVKGQKGRYALAVRRHFVNARAGKLDRDGIDECRRVGLGRGQGTEDREEGTGDRRTGVRLRQRREASATWWGAGAP